MYLTKEKVNNINHKYNNGLELKRKEKIYHQNIFGVRKAGLVYSLDNLELIEYAKCHSNIFYFIEKYCNIKLKQFQINFIHNYLENKFNIWMHSKQIGSSKIKACLMLHLLLFDNDKSIFLSVNKKISGIELLDIIKKIYIDLPFFLKKGVKRFDKESIRFDDNSLLHIHPRSKTAAIGRNYHLFVFEDMSEIPPNIIEPFYRCIVPIASLLKDCKILISGQPNGYNLFYDLVTGKDSVYNVTRTYWWEIEGRGEEWKQEIISKIGEKAFKQYYELIF